MTQRTHDLAAVALVSYRFLSNPPAALSWETLLGVGVATIIGALIPDIDNVASPAWKHKLLPWDGSATREFLQGHRHLSHSIIGIILFNLVVGWLLHLVALPNLDSSTVQQAFFYGQLSHLIADTFTIEGVPWLFPIPYKIGIPPFKFLRVRTGSWFERLIIFPGTLALTIWIYYSHRSVLISLLHSLRT